jgi:vacuolar-type H+-ATPase subunit I/STV1
MSTAVETTEEVKPATIPSFKDLVNTPAEKPAEKPATQEVTTAEEDEIPTDVFEIQKTPQQYAAERRAAKGKKVEEAKKEVASEYEPKINELTTTLQEREKALAELQAKLSKYEPELQEFKTLAETRGKEAEELRSNYFKTSLDVVSLNDDPDFVAAQQGIMSAFDTHMPTFVRGQNGETIPAAWHAVKKDPSKVDMVEGAVPYFVDGLVKGDAAMIDKAVSYVGAVMGANAHISANPEETVLLDRESPEYRSIFSALQGAAAHHQTKVQRMEAINQERPKLVQRKLDERAKHVTTILNHKVFMPKEQAVEVLQQDPTNTVALVAAMSEMVPEIKEGLQASAAHAAKVLAAVPEGFIIPPPADNSPEAIRDHQQRQIGMRQEVADLVALAASARSAGKIMAKLSEERDALKEELAAANERLKKHAVNTNPGGSKETFAAGDSDEIPTDVFAVG